MVEVLEIGNRKVAIKGIAKLFYEEGFPISLSIEELSLSNIEVSLYHIADQCWNNGWSSSTIMKKLRGECDIDINNAMSFIDWGSLEYFCSLLEQPQRFNGGYEESREIIHKYLFGDQTNSTNWLRENTRVVK
jgi:hypothetical protein